MKDNNNISQELLETTERYYNNTMSVQERLDFELKMTKDLDFKIKVEDLKTLILGIKNQSLKEQLDDFHKDISQTTNLETEKTSTQHLNWKRLLVAASLIIAAGSFWFFSGNSNERLYAKYFTPDPGLPTTMSSTDNYEFYEAMVDYKQGNYKTAISKWETLQKLKPSNDTLNYFIGVAYLAIKNEKNAIQFLEEVTKEPNFYLINDAHYYLGLAYLKSENVAEAKSSLQNSTIDNSKALLSELND